MRRTTCLSAFVLVSLLGRFTAAAPTPRQPVVPAALQPWVGWILDSDEGKTTRCPTPVGETSPVCAWPARLLLTFDDRGGSFSQEWQVFRTGFVGLPGDKDHWPLDVRLDGRPAPVVDESDAPKLKLQPGRHVLSGRFRWDSLPESLQAPVETGLVELVVRGKKIDFGLRDDEGRVFLGRKAEEKTEADTVDVSVHRKLTDEVPLLLTTRLVLAVSGKSRELLLGRAMPAGFEPVAVDSGLPLRFETDGRMRVQARPGTWTIEMRGQRVLSDRFITRPRPDGLWKEGDEAWVFEARPELREVVVDGVPQIDPAQTTLPDEWKALPAYALVPGATLTLTERRRGDAQPPPDRLTLGRTYWLDFDGGGYSVSDTITGSFTRAWRLEMGAETTLGRVAIGGQDQFITREKADGRAGVEIRNGWPSIEANSRIEGGRFTVPATSFTHDFDSATAKLKIPAGWRLFHASGADRITGTWFDAWSLGDVFLLLAITLMVGRLYGWRAGTLALLALGVTLVEPDAPQVMWLVLLGFEIAVRVVSRRPALTGLRVLRIGAWLAMGVVLLLFSIDEARQGLFPATARHREVAGSAAGEVYERAVSMLVRESRSQDRLEGTDGEVNWLKKAGDGRGHKGEQGKARLYGLRGPKENPVSVFGRDMAAGEDASGNLIGVQIGEAYGIAGLGSKGQGTIGLGLVGTGAGGGGTAAPALPPPTLFQYDPSVVVQTGQGLPRWSGSTAWIAFNGPVSQGQMLHFYLAPPWLNGLLAFARIALVTLLAWLLLRRPLHLRSGWIGHKPLVAGLATLFLLVPLLAWAGEIPPKEMLDNLKERLLEKPECDPNCAAINEMAVDAAPAELRIRLLVSAAAPTAIPLPGDASAWSPTSVRVDGKSAGVLARDGKGHLMLALVSGVFTVELQGPLPGRETIQLALPMRPRHASANVRGFRLDGIHEDGAVDESLLLSREPGASGTTSENTTPSLPPFLHVQRTLVLGLKWGVRTKVTRVSAAGTPIVIEIPLLLGESVTTAGIRVEKARGTASLSFAPGDNEIAWESTLAESTTIRLRADPTTASRWSESWLVQVGAFWHATFTGIPPVRRAQASTERVPEWRPWPGEEVHIAIDKPGGVTGRTLTIDASTLNLEPSLRSTQIGLVLELRSSRGTEHTIGLPAGAEVTSVSRDDVAQPIRWQGQDLILSIPPGKHTINVNWRQSVGVSSCFRTPAVDLRAPSTNSTVNLTLMEKPRWVLWLAGPFVGPVVGWWAVLAIVLLASIVLARTRLTPLRTHHWLLLGLGLTQIDPVASLFVVACLLCLGWRARMQANEARPVFYDLGQIALAVLILVSVYACVSVIDMGLGRLPDMFITGNQAAGNQLTWLQDRADPTLARPWVLSVPRWGYRLFIVAWALWLVVAALRWAPWVWSCLKQHGLWKPIAKPFTIPPRGA